MLSRAPVTMTACTNLRRMSVQSEGMNQSTYFVVERAINSILFGTKDVSLNDAVVQLHRTSKEGNKEGRVPNEKP